LGKIDVKGVIIFK